MSKDKQTKFPPPKLERFVRQCRVKLKREEIEERAARAAQLLADRDAKEAEQKAAAKHAKAIVDGIDSELRRVSEEVRSGETYRDVECTRTFDLRTKRLTETRNDTREIIFERPLTEGECQAELDLRTERQQKADELEASTRANAAPKGGTPKERKPRPTKPKNPSPKVIDTTGEAAP